jgi:hypothetical protein
VHLPPPSKCFIFWEISPLTPCRIGAISCAVTDVSIAAALAFSFYRMESRTVKGRTTQT